MKNYSLLLSVVALICVILLPWGEAKAEMQSNPRIEHNVPAQFNLDPVTGKRIEPLTEQEKEKLLPPLSFALRLLDDPFMARVTHGAKFVFDMRLGPGLYKYRIVNPNSLLHKLGTCSFISRNENEFDFLLSLWNQETIEHINEPDWETLQPQWDAFIERYWPNLAGCRKSDWRQAIAKYGAGRGVFPMLYSKEDQGLPVFQVLLDIRIADGKIGGVVLFNKHPRLDAFLKGKPIPPPPNAETIIAAIPRALLKEMERSRSNSGPESLIDVKKLRLISTERFFSKDIHLIDGFTTKVIVAGETQDGKSIRIEAWYDESRGTTDVEKWEMLDDNHKETKPEATKPLQKPILRVLDDQPQWSADGKWLYFHTTRDAKGRPWWQRGAVKFVQSMAVCHVQGNEISKPVMVRPIRPLGTDEGGYELGMPSPSGRYLAAARKGSRNQIFLLDMQEGVLHLPHEDRKWDAAMLRALPPTVTQSESSRWEIAGCDWLPDEKGLLLSLYRDLDLNLYLARPAAGMPPQEMELIEVDVERGDTILPRFGRGGRLLACGFSETSQNLQQKPDKQPEWKLQVADFDASTNKLSNRRSLDLSSMPASISWDKGGDRWLVVTKNGEMLWVNEVDGKLQSTPVSILKWGDNVLRPTSAAVSPDGTVTAVSGLLSKPLVFKDTEVFVGATIFLWDGKSSEVKPLFDPSLNGLPRYEFPATKSTWAQIKGNVRKFGLNSIADPEYFLDAPATTNTN